jgi:hypothetical protein
LAGRAIHWLGFEQPGLSDQEFYQSFRTDVMGLLNTLKSAGVANVVLLSCFPAANHRVNRMRHIANRVLLEKVEHFGGIYVDLWPKLSFAAGPLRGVARPGLLADSGHLNVKGHRIVAEEIRSAVTASELHCKLATNADVSVRDAIGTS